MSTASGSKFLPLGPASPAGKQLLEACPQEECGHTTNISSSLCLAWRALRGAL